MNKKAKIFRVINGDETTAYDNEYSLGEALVDLVTSNDSVTFTTSEDIEHDSIYININVE